MRIKETIRGEGHCNIRKGEKGELCGVYSEEDEVDPAVKRSLVTCVSIVS